MPVPPTTLHRTLEMKYFEEMSGRLSIRLRYVTARCPPRPFPLSCKGISLLYQSYAEPFFKSVKIYRHKPHYYSAVHNIFAPVTTVGKGPTIQRKNLRQTLKMAEVHQDRDANTGLSFPRSPTAAFFAAKLSLTAEER